MGHETLALTVNNLPRLEDMRVKPVFRMGTKVNMPEGGWVPVERTNFWDYKGTGGGPEQARYESFMADVSLEAEAQIPIMARRVADFFGIPKEYYTGCLPKFSILDTVAGGTATHVGSSNEIAFPVKYAFPLFLGDVKDLRQTHFYDALGHETAHFVQMAALNKGNIDGFRKSYLSLDHIGLEFFCGIADRLIAEDLQIVRPARMRTDYTPDDAHIGLAIADEKYEELQAMSLSGRLVLALDYENILAFIGKEDVDKRQQVLKEAWEKQSRDRRRRGWMR